MEEGKTAKDAALISGINIRTAQHYIKKYNDDEEKRLPIRCSKPTAGRTGKLTEEHSRFLVEYIDEHPAAVLSDIKHGFSWTDYINLSVASTVGAKM
jgi:transposase